MPDGVMDTIETATYVRCSPAALRSWRKNGSGPRFYRAGRLVRYRLADVELWIHNNSYSKGTAMSRLQKAELVVSRDELRTNMAAR